MSIFKVNIVMRYDFLLLCFATIILAVDVFIYPPPANSIPDDSDQLPRFKEGTTVTLRWSSNLDIVSIGLRTKGDNIILQDGTRQGSILGMFTSHSVMDVRSRS